jgi:chaperonin cofactor prefoldin
VEKRLPLKNFHSVSLARRLGQGTLGCAIFVAATAVPRISHAAHRRHPNPKPSMSVAMTAGADTTVTDWDTPRVIALSVSLAIGAFFLGKTNSKAKKALTKAIQELEAKYKNQRMAFEDANEKREALQERLERDHKVLAAREAELVRAYRDITKLRARLAEMLQVDPEIEKKALDAARDRANAEAAIAAQKKIEMEGQAKLDDLLIQMRGGA